MIPQTSTTSCITLTYECSNAQWSTELQFTASAYMVDHRLRAEDLLPVDVVLMLLRIGSPEALEHVTKITGHPITHCPPAVPPWPPKPVAKTKRGPILVRVEANAYPRQTSMHDRFAKVRLGMTREQLLTRGVTARDIRYWQKNDRIEFEGKRS